MFLRINNFSNDYLIFALFIITIITQIEQLLVAKKNTKIFLFTNLLLLFIQMNCINYLFLNKFNINIHFISKVGFAISAFIFIQCLFNSYVEKKYNQIFLRVNYIFIPLIIGFFILIKTPFISNSIFYTNLVFNSVFFFKIIIIINLIIYLVRVFVTTKLKLENLDNLYLQKVKTWITPLIVVMLCQLGINIFFSFQLKGYILLQSKTDFIFELVTTLTILFQPSFLKKSKDQLSYFNLFTIKTEIGQSQKLTFQQKEMFNQFFFSNFYYLKSDANIEEMKESLNVDGEALKLFIQQEYNKSFVDLTNQYRIKYFVSLIQSNKYSDYTVEALGQISGFGSRQNLYNNFRKFHGGNPSDLISIATSNTSALFKIA